jgi:hypothetical protein
MVLEAEKSKQITLTSGKDLLAMPSQGGGHHMVKGLLLQEAHS